ncbi:MAG: oxidoreductase [Nitrososphaerota archaeon]
MSEGTSLRGTVAAITGGTSGIGLATAKALAMRGSRVYLIARDERRAARAMKEQGLSGSATFLRADVTRADELKAAFGEIERREPALDFLVCSAGALLLAPLQELGEEQWDYLYAVNVKGCFLACKLALPLLKRSPRASIVLLSSIAAVSPYPRGAAYCSSKAAVLALAKALALELAPMGIRVNCVAPGVVRTPLIEGALGGPPSEEAWRKMGASIPLGRVAEPEELAELIAFVLANARYSTGALYTLDGGITAGRGAAAVDHASRRA